MTYRERLYNKAIKVIEEEEARKAAHLKIVEEYIDRVLNEAAEEGRFYCTIAPVLLSDGSKLNKEEVQKFAEDNDLNYTSENGFPTLSFDKKCV